MKGEAKKTFSRSFSCGHAQKFINTKNSEREPLTYHIFLTIKIIKTRNLDLQKDSYF